MSEEKDILNELPEEEETLEQTEETLEQTEETVELPADEEAQEVDETVLYEQDLLDGEPEEAPTYEEMQAEKPTLTYEELQESNFRLRRTNKILSIVSGVAVFLVLLCAGVIIGMFSAGKADEPFAGLTLGKSYKSNIVLADYSALTYEDTYAAPTEADIMKQIHSKMGADHKKEIEVTDALQSGDVTNITFDGYIDGKIFESACAEKYDLTLGSGSFIPGFEDGLIGKKVGESVTLSLTFPADYSEASLQGKDVRFEVVINSAKRTVYDELTDALVKEITKDEYTTVTAYKDAVYAELETTAKSDAVNNAKNAVWTTVANGTTLKKYPQNIYDHFVARLEKQFSSYYSSYGVTDLEGFMQKNGLELKSYVEGQIIYEYAIYTIAAEQGITVEDADYNAMFTQYGVTSKEALAEKAGVEPWELESSILYEKVTNFLYENAKVK